MQQDTYNIIHDARRQHEANLAISQIERLVFRGGYYGYDNGGTFVPMYDRYRRPIGRREATITGAGIGASIGTGIGSLKNRPGAGALLGAGGGALLGLVLSGRGGEDKPVDCSKKLNRKERETCSAIAAEQQAAILQQQIAIQQDEAQRLAQTYYNRTGRPVDIRDVIGNLVADIPNGGSVDLPESSGGYKAYMRFPAALGKTAFRPADQRLAKDGSGFVLIFPVGGGV
ncbi:MAG: hypothetical protein HYX20_01630 [Candidatus Yanofskybacteria bacterium]|nr:hypothetical protein [Candidatus Yanofskybacteria bacterium]